MREDVRGREENERKRLPAQTSNEDNYRTAKR